MVQKRARRATSAPFFLCLLRNSNAKIGAFLASATATAALDADDRIICTTATGQRWCDADGLGGQGSAQIAAFGSTTHPGLAYSDFFIVA